MRRYPRKVLIDKKPYKVESAKAEADLLAKQAERTGDQSKILLADGDEATAKRATSKAKRLADRAEKAQSQWIKHLQQEDEEILLAA